MFPIHPNIDMIAVEISNQKTAIASFVYTWSHVWNSSILVIVSFVMLIWNWFTWWSYDKILDIASQKVWAAFSEKALIHHINDMAQLFVVITRPNCAVDRRTILCLYVPGIQRQVFERFPKCKWISLTTFPWIPRTNTFNANFVGSLVLLRIPQRANIVSCSGFRICKRVPQI